MRTAATVVAAPGTVLAGKLRVERLIGQGAMGIVYEATDITLRRRVAVKLVHPDFLNDPEKRLRFGREAYAVSRLQSQHVTQVLEISELDDGTPYFVMELLEGRTLDQVIEHDGPAAVHVALDWVLQALDAVSEAHHAGLVHRDLKPANLYLVQRKDRSPIVKVLDFGLVKDMSAEVKLTITGSTMGSPAYMAPEQVNVDQVVDARTDVWAMGITLFELLTRELPFDGQSIPMMLRQVLRDEPIPLRAKRPDAPPELDMIIAKCLAKDPNMRFADAAELRRALAQLRARMPEVTDATKTVRLPEGTVVPAGANPMDMMDISSVRPRLVAGDPQAITGRSVVETPRARPEPSPKRVMFISAAITTALVVPVAWIAIAYVRARPVPAPVPAANPPAASTQVMAPPASVSTPAPASAVPPAPSVILSAPKVTFNFPGAVDADQQNRWTARAEDLGSCGRAAVHTCARAISIRRDGHAHVAVEPTAKDCKVPPETAKCVERIVKDQKLTSSVTLTFH